jgi:hypothetical protein
VLSAVNKLSLSNCDVCSESVFTAELWSQQRISFHCRIVLSVVNSFSLPNCVVCSKSIFVAIDVKHLNVNIWILEIGMVMSHVISECKGADL